MSKLSSFLKNKIINYYETSTTPMKCINYLKLNYPQYNLKYDHIAFRSICNEKYDFLKNTFIQDGYHKMNTINIPLSNNDDTFKHAIWFKNQYNKIPRIFLSIGYPTSLENYIIDSNRFSNQEKEDMLNERKDDYVKWTWLFDTEINHIALDMSDYGDDFYKVIETMINDLNLTMNNSDNIYQISKDKKLIQCSTKADLFNNKSKNFIEFVRRIDNRDGFEGDNAAVIFESTKY